ncbi:MAG: hypothetical protein AB8B58_15025 [Roseobacter sp.]
MAPAASLPHAVVLLASLTLASCGTSGLSPADRSELDNMWRFNQAPKSDPSQMVAAFDRFCVNTPRASAETALRRVGYVPLPEKTPGAQGWVVDDSRPAVAISDKMCVVRAKSRSGQTSRFTDYVARAFPQAAPTDPALLGEAVEAAWRVAGPALVATERRRDVDFFVYTLIYYTPEAT